MIMVVPQQQQQPKKNIIIRVELTCIKKSASLEGRNSLFYINTLEHLLLLPN